MLSWKKKVKPELILSTIDQHRNRTPGGESYSLEGAEPAMQAPILESMLDFPTYVLRSDWSRIVFLGLCKALSPLSRETFLAAASEAAETISARPIQKYVVLSSMSISSDTLPASFTWSSCSFKVFPSAYPRKYKSRLDCLKEFIDIADDTPKKYCRLAISVQAKSPEQAVNQALIKLNEVRAMLNFVANRAFEYSGGFMTPVNRIRLGRIHTVHFPDGTLASEMIWHESNFKPAAILDMSAAPNTYKQARRFLARLKTFPYAEDITDALSLFVRALDEQDANIAFLRLWSALERLVTSEQDALIRRCAFPFHDPERRILTLQHLRHFRNAAVHEGVETENAKREIYLLLGFFRAIIRFHLANGFLFSDLVAANQFLDFPTDREELQKRRRLIQRAIFYRSPAQK